MTIGRAAPAEPAPAEPAPAEPAPAEPAPAEPAPAEPAPAEPAGEYGEVYEADPAILEHALFDASLLPADEMSANIALAAYGRSDATLHPVDYDLALECWQNNGCDTGTGGELTVGYVEGFGENIYREISKMEFILQALTYPEIGEIIYTSAQSNPDQALTDFRAAISQGVDVIVTYPDFGDAMLPVFPGGDRRRDAGRDLRLGLRDRAGRELPDRGRRGHLRARRGLCGGHEH